METEKSSTTPETAAEFESNGGATYEVRPSGILLGFYQIIQTSGGRQATVCNEFFTSHANAQKALVRYLQDTDRMGYAKYPGKKRTRG